MSFKHDDAKIRQTHQFEGLSVPGTNASAADKLRIPLVSGVRLNKMRVRFTTGGTAATPVIVINKSLAGTGANSPIGTIPAGTRADGSVLSVDLTTTDFDANDEIVISVAAGTGAATPVISGSLGYVD